MPHFSEEDWADFVRGIDVSTVKREMEAHLASSCRECNSAFDLWGSVVQLAAKENDYAPPDSLIRLVKAHSPLRNKRSRRSSSATVASLE
jgi:hypothetical protein